jgi:hypothetical protein
MTIYAEPPDVVPGQVMSAANWNDWVVEVAKAMWIYTTAGDTEYALSATQKQRLGIGALGALYRSDGSKPTWLAKGAAKEFLRVNAGGTDLEYINPFKGVLVSVAGPVSISNNTNTMVSFTTENIDDNNYWSAGSPTRLTMPETGWYMLGALVTYANNSSGVRNTNIVFNGTPRLAVDSRMPLSGAVTNVTLGNPYYLGATNYVELQVFQNSGGALDITNAVLIALKV